MHCGDMQQCTRLLLPCTASLSTCVVDLPHAVSVRAVLSAYYGGVKHLRRNGNVWCQICASFDSTMPSSRSDPLRSDSFSRLRDTRTDQVEAFDLQALRNQD